MQINIYFLKRSIHRQNKVISQFHFTFKVLSKHKKCSVNKICKIHLIFQKGYKKMIDEIDKKILDELSKNSRLTMKKLGKKYISLHQQPHQE